MAIEDGRGRAGVRRAAHRGRASRLRARPAGQPHVQRPRRRLRPGAGRPGRAGLRVLEEGGPRRGPVRVAGPGGPATAPPCSPWSGCSSSSPTPRAPWSSPSRPSIPRAGPGQVEARLLELLDAVPRSATPVRVMSFSARSLHRIRAAAPHIPTVYLMQLLLPRHRDGRLPRGRTDRRPQPPHPARAPRIRRACAPVGQRGARVDGQRAGGRRDVRTARRGRGDHKQATTGARTTALRAEIAPAGVRYDTLAPAPESRRKPNSPSLQTSYLVCVEAFDSRIRSSELRQAAMRGRFPPDVRGASIELAWGKGGLGGGVGYGTEGACFVDDGRTSRPGRRRGRTAQDACGPARERGHGRGRRRRRSDPFRTAQQRVPARAAAEPGRFRTSELEPRHRRARRQRRAAAAAAAAAPCASVTAAARASGAGSGW